MPGWIPCLLRHQRPHLEAMIKSGLQIEGPDEEFVIHPIKVTAEPEEIGQVD